MFQLFAAKQTLGIAGCNVNQAYYTPEHDKQCPSCGVEFETCGHILTYKEAGRVEVLHHSIDLLDSWLQENGMERRLRQFIVRYAHCAWEGRLYYARHCGFQTGISEIDSVS